MSIASGITAEIAAISFSAQSWSAFLNGRANGPLHKSEKICPCKWARVTLVILGGLLRVFRHNFDCKNLRKEIMQWFVLKVNLLDMRGRSCTLHTWMKPEQMDIAPLSCSVPLSFRSGDSVIFRRCTAPPLNKYSQLIGWMNSRNFMHATCIAAPIFSKELMKQSDSMQYKYC